MAIYELDGQTPTLADSCWVADSAQVMGRVEMGEDSSVWFGSVLRGDSEQIRISASAPMCRTAACCMPTRAFRSCWATM